MTTKKLKLESAKPEMVEEILTDDLQKAVHEARRPLIQKFQANHNHQGIIAGYQFTVTVTDGLLEYKGLMGTTSAKEWKRIARDLGKLRINQATAA